MTDMADTHTYPQWKTQRCVYAADSISIIEMPTFSQCSTEQPNRQQTMKVYIYIYIYILVVYYISIYYSSGGKTAYHRQQCNTPVQCIARSPLLHTCIHIYVCLECNGQTASGADWFSLV